MGNGKKNQKLLENRTVLSPREFKALHFRLPKLVSSCLAVWSAQFNRPIRIGIDKMFGGRGGGCSHAIVGRKSLGIVLDLCDSRIHGDVEKARGHPLWGPRVSAVVTASPVTGYSQAVVCAQSLHKTGPLHISSYFFQKICKRRQLNTLFGRLGVGRKKVAR